MRHTQNNHLMQTVITTVAIYLRILFVNISAHLMANMPASVQTLRNSAPVELGHSRASSSYLEKRHKACLTFESMQESQSIYVFT